MLHFVCDAQSPASSSTRDGGSYDIATNSALGFGQKRYIPRDDIDGSPFFNDEYVMGNVKFANGLFQDSLQLKYDLASYTFLSKDKEDAEFAINSRSIAEYRLFIDDEEVLFKRVDPKYPKIFYEIIYQEKGLTFYKSENVKVVKGEELGIASTNSRFFREARYYVKKGIEIRRIKLKKKDVWYYLTAEQKQRLDQYLKEHKIKLKKDTDFKRVLSILNG